MNGPQVFPRQFTDGERVTNEFGLSLIRRTRRQVYRTRRRMDMALHIDLIMPNEPCDVMSYKSLPQWPAFVVNEDEDTFDVKCLKRIARRMEDGRDGPLQDKYLLLEHVCRGGGKGWLYGDEKYIAFLTFGGFLIVKRIYLADAFGKKVHDNVPRETPNRWFVDEFGNEYAEPPVVYDQYHHNEKDCFFFVELEEVKRTIPYMIFDTEFTRKLRIIF